MSRVITFHGATLGVSEYSIPAIDVAVVGGEVQFLTADGVLAFDPAADAPAGYVETGDLNLSGGSVCNVSPAYLVVQSDGPLMLMATWKQGASRTKEYPVPVRPGDEERARTVPMGKGPRGNSWRLRIASAGGDWTLSGFEVLVDRVGRTR